MSLPNLRTYAAASFVMPVALYAMAYMRHGANWVAVGDDMTSTVVKVAVRDVPDGRARGFVPPTPLRGASGTRPQGRRVGC